MLYDCLFALFFVLFSIKADEVSLPYKYSNFFQLYNDDYLLCTEKGIFLYDSQLRNLKEEYPFASEISLEDFNYVNIEQFTVEEGGYGVILYKDTFYFFSNSGIIIFPYPLPFTPSGNGFTLVLQKKK